MDYDWEFSERIQCSEAEKKECMTLVAEVVAMANKAKRNARLPGTLAGRLFYVFDPKVRQIKTRWQPSTVGWWRCEVRMQLTLLFDSLNLPL